MSENISLDVYQTEFQNHSYLFLVLATNVSSSTQVNIRPCPHEQSVGIFCEDFEAKLVC